VYELLTNKKTKQTNKQTSKKQWTCGPVDQKKNQLALTYQDWTAL